MYQDGTQKQQSDCPDGTCGLDHYEATWKLGEHPADNQPGGWNAQRIAMVTVGVAVVFVALMNTVFFVVILANILTR